MSKRLLTRYIVLWLKSLQSALNPIYFVVNKVLNKSPFLIEINTKGITDCSFLQHVRVDGPLISR